MVQELEAGPRHRFGDWPNDQVPKRAAGVYTVWDGDRLAYRFVVTADGAEAGRLEAGVRRGALSVGRPYLNPLEPPWS
jgi:hypothetical protein